MTDILSIINSGNGNIRLEVTGEDLLHFSNQLIRKTKEEMATDKRDYLKPVKIGSKLRYRLSDIKKLLGEQSH